MPDTPFDPRKNYLQSLKKCGYIARDKSKKTTYSRLGFKSGLEIHQQLLTDKKLFCHCPAGIFQKNGEYDAEVVRHMRPTLSELGEYDGTALMEFKTRKNIFYRIANTTTCTYETDDTPPFKINRQALEIALEIALLLKTNIVGELHITRKQYLDGSIPTGFQRTAIVGIEGELPLSKKTVRVIQISIEEDSCREVSDIRHDRVYTTDRLGMPLIETVTYPDMLTPDEVAEAAHYIRFMNRSTGHVRTGIGSTRQDVNVSINGGTRVEIKGVAHIRWIPALTHNEAFRQKSFLLIRDELKKRISKSKDWHTDALHLSGDVAKSLGLPVQRTNGKKDKLIAVNLPGFRGILSFFNQPQRIFADEISDRLKVIACIEKPNMVHSEMISGQSIDFSAVRKAMNTKANDAQIVFWAPAEDVNTALEVIEERCRMAFEGVPNETRKALADGTTLFERVLPGADRMYPDTDSAPIPIDDDLISRVEANLPVSIHSRLAQLKKWQIPEDTYEYLLRFNLLPLLERIIADFDASPCFIATLLAHRLKNIQGKITPTAPFHYERIYRLVKFIRENDLQWEILYDMMPLVYEQPNMDFESILISIDYSNKSKESILEMLPILRAKFKQINTSDDPHAGERWMMKELRKMAVGNMPLAELARNVREGAEHE